MRRHGTDYETANRF